MYYHVVLLAFVAVIAAEPVCKSVYIKHDGKHTKLTMETWTKTSAPHSFEAGETAHACFDDVISTTGWSWLNMYGNPTLADLDVARAAGYIEGYTTWKRIHQHSLNTNVAGHSLPTKVRAWVDENIRWQQQMFADALLSPDETDHQYWHQVQLAFEQVKAIHEGYSDAAKANKGPEMSFTEIWTMNFGSSFFTIEAALDKAFLDKMVEGDYDSIIGSSHCSGLVLLAPKNADLFSSQVSWDRANGMMRIYKMYDLPYKLSAKTSKQVPARRSTFSSYPAMIFSGDDFYVTSAGMVVMETTIGNSNPQLLRDFITPFSVLEGIRNVIANRLSTNGPDWRDWYKMFNSGTYNNQNMIVDFKLFKPGQTLKNNTFWVVEQLPGFVIGGDVSAVLQKDGYWGSYNTPYFPKTSELSGNDAAIKKYGSWFTYWGTARAEIYRRNHTMVHDLDGMKKLMRYNNFKHDPLSTQLNTCQYIGWKNCTPPYTSENSISCRDDLNDPHGVYAIGAFGLRDHVGMDAKIASYSMYTKDPESLTTAIQSGPTYDQQPIFKFSTSPYANTSWVGLPDEWHFPWITKKWN